ncbi:hypothetical protein FOXYSP1_14188 [Fusarium oxysporum f. sp. phaseoli]
MGTPADHLPPPISEDAINKLLQTLRLPRATAIENPKMIAQYHSIYFITLPPIELSRGHYELVLRVAGHHLPNIKTKNEIGVMTWLSKNTIIPLPDVIAYDGFTNIPVGHEYTLLSHIQGVTLSDVYDRLSDEQMNQILDQLIDLLTQLQAHPWDGIGGLTLDDHGITGILDWKFAGVVPYPQWNPRSSFLWSGIDTPESLDEEYKLLEVFKQRCKEKGCKLFGETEYTSSLQEDMQRAVDFLRAIVEVSPRGQRQELVQGWKDMVLENIVKFGA